MLEAGCRVTDCVTRNAVKSEGNRTSEHTQRATGYFSHHFREPRGFVILLSRPRIDRPTSLHEEADLLQVWSGLGPQPRVSAKAWSNEPVVGTTGQRSSLVAVG